MIKILAVTVVCVVLLSLLKQYKSDYSVIFKLCVITVIGFLIIEQFNSGAFTFSFLYDIDSSSVPFFPIIFKTLGIVIITQLACDICKDSGEEALSTVTELVGKVFILINCLPLMEVLFSLVKGYLEA